jgi:hypothetical protein
VHPQSRARETLKHADNVIASTERMTSEDDNAPTISCKEPDTDLPVDNASVYEK